MHFEHTINVSNSCYRTRRDDFTHYTVVNKITAHFLAGTCKVSHYLCTPGGAEALKVNFSTQPETLLISPSPHKNVFGWVSVELPWTKLQIFKQIIVFKDLTL